MPSLLYDKGLWSLQTEELSLDTNDIEIIPIFNLKILFVPKSTPYPVLNTRQTILSQFNSTYRQGTECE